MTLTAVDEFARLHEAGDLPDNAEHYRTLLPTSAPAEGEQYAFAVDLDTCTGCKACVVACHSLNGLDDDESWRSVGLIQGGREVAFQQTVTTACHHCVEPACLSGCPVDAYEKDPVTGIVAHLDDQCIGCSYCTLTCPYEVPRFNKSRGIVRKCDMCRGRLAEGEAPACVQACPNGAISITIVEKAAVRTAAPLVPGAPSSALTTPTTTYTTSRAIPEDARAADHFALRPAHSHPPLAVMLVLTQMAVGALAFDVALRAAGSERVGWMGSAIAAATGVLALLASTLHLGRPLYAFRAVLGVSHSWLSREIVAFAAFAAAAPVYAVTGWLAVGVGALVAGVAGMACSVMLYAVTKRTWWRPSRSSVTFALSAAITGGAVSSTWLFGTEAVATAQTVCAVTGSAAVAKFLRDVSIWWRGHGSDDIARAARLLRGDLRVAFQLRLLLLAFGGVGAPFVVAAAVTPPTHVNATLTMSVATALVVAAEMIERNHFFQVAVAPRMPGELR